MAKTKTRPRAKTKSKLELPSPPSNDAPLMDWAIWCAEFGKLTGSWKVFQCVPGEKRPLHKGWQKEATWDRESIKTVWGKHPKANIGLAIEPGFVAVDVDDWQALEKLEDKHGDFPATYEQKTARGGGHFVCATELDTGNATGNLPKGIDIRGHRGYIVGAGSVLVEKGKEAGRWSVKARQAPVPLPKWFEGYLTERKASKDKPRKDYGEPTPWDHEQAKRLVEFVEQGELIKDYDGPFQEGERDNKTFQLFAEAKNRMIHPDVMLEAVEGSGIDGGLEDDVERKMQSAYYDGNTQDSYGSKVPSYWLPNHVFKAVVDGKTIDRPPADPVEWKTANPNKLPKAFQGDSKRDEEANGESELSLIERMQAALRYDVTSFLAIPAYPRSGLKLFPEVEWDIDRLIGRAKMGMIVGRWGHYKTFIALDMAVALATQLPWPAIDDKGCRQYAIPKPRRVLYIAAEGGAAEYNQRLEAIEQNRKKIDDDQLERNFFLATASAPLDMPAGQLAIADLIERATKHMGGAPEVIFFDTLAQSMAGEENSNSDMGKVQKVAAAIQRALDCTFIFIHHVGKDGEKSGRGASSMPASLDFLLHVSGEEATKVATVNVEKQRAAPAEKNIFLQGRSVNRSLAFARIKKIPVKRSDQEADGIMRHLGQIIEDGKGKSFSIRGLAQQLAGEVNDDFEDMEKGKQERCMEKIRYTIRQTIIESKTTEAKDFRDRYCMGAGSNTKWVYKDSNDDLIS